MNVASLLIVWRPFLAPYWASLSYAASKAPANFIWTRQFVWALLWLQEFLLQNQGEIVRVFEYENYFAATEVVQITADASPFGFGAWLQIHGVITAWFADDISATDELVLDRKRGSHEGQQAFEALVLLVALRLWQTHFRKQRTVLSVRSDNVGALTVIASLKGSGHSLNLVARELALDLGRCEFLPRIVAHIPGVANGAADELSRKFDPSKQPWHIPALLACVPETTAPARPESWWRVWTFEHSHHVRQAKRS